MNLTECQKIAEVTEWLEDMEYPAPGNSSRYKDIDEVNLTLHQAALIGATLMQVEAARVAGNSGGNNSAASNIRALDAAAIVKKGM